MGRRLDAFAYTLWCAQVLGVSSPWLGYEINTTSFDSSTILVFLFLSLFPSFIRLLFRFSPIPYYSFPNNKLSLSLTLGAAPAGDRTSSQSALTTLPGAVRFETSFHSNEQLAPSICRRKSTGQKVQGNEPSVRLPTPDGYRLFRRFHKKLGMHMV